jgi:hypothetical protein
MGMEVDAGFPLKSNRRVLHLMKSSLQSHLNYFLSFLFIVLLIFS